MRGTQRYPLPPGGWTIVERHSAGPFVTGVRYRHPDGRTAEWSSRWHRKHASRLSRPREGREHLLWAPHRASWWISVLFSIGATCFLVGPFPAFLDLVGSHADAVVFFVGSVFFTSAAALQWLEAVNADQAPGAPRTGRLRVVAWEPRRIDWWSTGVQLLGTVFFNVTTFRAVGTAVDASTYDQVVWRPDAYGSVCFLVSGALAYAEVAGGLFSRPPRTLEGSIVAVNLFGCLAFGVSAVGGYVVPGTGSPADVAIADVATSVGALAFLVGALLLLPEGTADQARTAPDGA